VSVYDDVVHLYRALSKDGQRKEKSSKAGYFLSW
jgi:hypothetical protein